MVSTETMMTTTDLAVIDIFSSTITDTATIVHSFTNFYIQQALTSNATSTVVIPIPSGFVGVQASSGETIYVLKTRTLTHLAGSSVLRRAAPKAPKGTPLAHCKYPKSVTCIKYVSAIGTI
ncbi:MAG: hypothetical protein Q9166_002703 [cf. Caloplaca sp. 2 TL-2023]